VISVGVDTINKYFGSRGPVVVLTALGEWKLLRVRRGVEGLDKCGFRFRFRDLERLFRGVTEAFAAFLRLGGVMIPLGRGPAVSGSWRALVGDAGHARPGPWTGIIVVNFPLCCGRNFRQLSTTISQVSNRTRMLEAYQL
jgi:hypothetical protein